MLSGSPSTSVSLPNTSMTTGCPVIVEALSSLATGASFSGVTSTVTVEVSKPPCPSVTVTSKLSVPLKSASGV